MTESQEIIMIIKKFTVTIHLNSASSRAVIIICNHIADLFNFS